MPISRLKRIAGNTIFRISISTATFAVYTALFPLVHNSLGDVTPVLSYFPILLTGYLLGMRGGLFAGIFGIFLNIALLRIAGDPLGYKYAPNILGGVTALLIAVAIGWIKGLLDKVKRQSEELLQERKKLEEEVELRMRAEESIKHDALHDALTNIPNRRLFADRLAHALEWTRRFPDDISAVLYLDFDGFKSINDNYGHHFGDQLLVNLAKRLKSSLRTVDTVGRMGGDEFAILLQSVRNNDDVIMIVERLRKNLSVPIEIEETSVVLTASIGVVINFSGYSHIDEIIHDADTAMYIAKLKGKNDYKIFDVEMRETADDVIKIESDLHNALQNSEFVLHYQPVYRLKNQHIKGFEALIRWQHPQRGLLMPADFLHIAEDSGLIISIGEWVLEEACLRIKNWKNRFKTEAPPTISVNISSRQFVKDEFPAQVKNILEKTGVSGECLLLEVTETTLIGNISAATARIEKLRELGVGFAIDDFGTGYSSLGYLRHLNVNHLKIDHSFVSTLGVSKTGLPIVRAITAMADSLEMDVIAEGIETEEQLKSLKSLDCKYGQGYYFSKPLTAQEAEKLLKKLK